MAFEERIGQLPGFDGAFLKVRVDQVRLPSGRDSIREVVAHPGAVAIVAVTNDGDLLLVRQHRYPTGGELLEIPAGTREAGEDAADTARRELIEETGYDAESLTEVYRFYSSPGYSTEEIVLFHAAHCSPIAHDRDPDEPTKVELVPVTDLANVLAPGSNALADGKTLIGLLWLHQQLGTRS